MEAMKTLMLREWMQNRTGWTVVMVIPALLFVAGLVFGNVAVDLGDGGEPRGPHGPLLVAMASIGGLLLPTLALAWGAALLQSPGLARRDVQDRSIEFWLSLPVSHLRSLGATLLVHLVLVPWAALAVGLAAGLVLSLPAVARTFGAGEWVTLPWGAILPAAAAFAARMALGVVLATLWLSPLILGTMAASAWLKRWGLPAVVGAIVGAGLVLDKVYGSPAVWVALQTLGQEATLAFLAEPAGGMKIEHGEQMPAVLAMLPVWALEDAGRALARLAQPSFLAALGAGAAAFGLLWWRRARGA